MSRIASLSTNVTVLPTSAVPMIVSSFWFVTVPSDGDKSAGGAGIVASTVTVVASEESETLPATSVAVAVKP